MYFCFFDALDLCPELLDTLTALQREREREREREYVCVWVRESERVSEWVSVSECMSECE